MRLAIYTNLDHDDINNWALLVQSLLGMYDFADLIDELVVDCDGGPLTTACEQLADEYGWHMCYSINHVNAAKASDFTWFIGYQPTGWHKQVHKLKHTTYIKIPPNVQA